MPVEALEKALEKVWSGEQVLTTVERQNVDGQTEKIAEGYEIEMEQTAVIEGQEVTWRERRLFVHSFMHA